ncbi:MAG: restriction endonuclease subunit S [Nitrospira sp.]
MKLQPYPHYKPSGVEWLGDVPKHWEVKRLKWIGDSIIGLTYSPDELVNEEEGTLVLRASNIQDGRIVLDDNVFVSSEIPRKLRTRAHDLLICSRNGSRDLVGKTALITKQEEGLTFGAFTTIFRSASNDFAFWVFNSGLFKFQAGLYQTSTIYQLTIGTLNSFHVPMPPPVEQRAIAAFLEREMGRVDRLMAKKRDLIARLREKRTALISRTVTRGLPPTAARAAGLSENPLLKPSGLDWHGEIPKHWQVLPFTKYVAEKSDYRGKTPDKQPDGVFLVTARNVRMGFIDYESSQEFIAKEDYNEVMRRGLPKKGDILFTTEAPLGNVALVDREDIALAQRIIRFRMSPAHFDSEFILFAMMSDHFQVQLKSLSTGSTAEGLKASKLPILRLIAPPLPEQVAIATYLDKETAKLDALVGKVEEAVERLQEYRTALITAAVTGKIDVRMVTAP